MKKHAPYFTITINSKKFNVSQIISLCILIIIFIISLQYYKLSTDEFNWKDTQFKNGGKNILILGDSISIGYSKEVISYMPSHVNILRPISRNHSILPKVSTSFQFGNDKTLLLYFNNNYVYIDHGMAENCQDTSYSLQNIEHWLGKNKFDIVHANWGIWDSTRFSAIQYKNNIQQLIYKIKPHARIIILATTTLTNDPNKNNKIIEFNSILKEISNKDDHIILNDLNKVAINKSLLLKDGTHFNDEGYDTLAKQTINLLLNNI